MSSREQKKEDIPEDELAEIKEAFSLYDSDGKNEIKGSKRTEV
jgi:Ca2+-binding EF-hand superfamily protein